LSRTSSPITLAGRAISLDTARLPPVALKLEINPVAVTTKEMVARLNDPNVQIVDVRTPQEFIGEDIRAIRGGHIPGQPARKGTRRSESTEMMWSADRAKGTHQRPFFCVVKSTSGKSFRVLTRTN
jgi:3-mercaptopyruvate sulfurtransferase SseA